MTTPTDSRPGIVDLRYQRAEQAAARAAARLTTYFEERPSLSLLVKAREDLSEAVNAWNDRDVSKDRA